MTALATGTCELKLAVCGELDLSATPQEWKADSSDQAAADGCFDLMASGRIDVGALAAFFESVEGRNDIFRCNAQTESEVVQPLRKKSVTRSEKNGDGKL